MNQESTAASAVDGAVAPRLTMRLIVHQFAERFLNVERGWMRTARELTVGPGAMIRRYVEGQRKVYANPFAYLVAAMAVSLIAQKLFGMQEKMIDTARGNAIESPLQMEFVNRFTELLFQNMLFVSLGIVVPLALLLRLFFLRSGYNLAESFVFALYSAGHLALLGAVLVPVHVLLPPSSVIQAIVSVTVAIAYTVYAARGFFPGGLVAVVFKTTVAYVMAYVVFLAVMMVGTVVYVVAVMAPGSSGEVWDLVTATDYGLVPVVEKLLDEGADVNTTVQRTALHAAAENGNLEIVDMLIGHGADVNLQDIHGRVPMFVALVNGHPGIANRLAEAGTDATVRTVDGSTLLMAALWAEDEDLVRWAVNGGADVNAARSGKRKPTALIIAASEGRLDMIDLLLAHGADPAIVNRGGKTALDFAGSEEIRQRLRDATAPEASRPQAEDPDAGGGGD